MFKKVFIATCLFTTSLAAQAALISHYDYQRDSTTHIVKGGGLEWLKWDLTKGKTVNQALADHAGWRLATGTEMVSLFNTFTFGLNDWVHGQPTWYSMPWTRDEASPHNAFIELFGFTYADKGVCKTSDSRGCYLPTDNMITSRAWFAGATAGKVGSATILDDYMSIGVFASQNPYSHVARIEFDRVENATFPDWSVALVRANGQQPVTVNTPASFSLLLLGFAALGWRRRQMLRRSA